MNIPTLSVSRETVRRIHTTRTNRHTVMKQQYGAHAADNVLGGRSAGVVTTRPLERVEIDHTLCDVHLVDEKTRKPIGRPWLTLVVDHYSGAVLGYHLSMNPPSAASVIAALRHAILPKTGTWTLTSQEDSDYDAA